MSPERPALRPTLRAVCVDLDGTLYSIRRMMWGHLRTLWPLRGFFRELNRVRRELRREGRLADYRAEQARRLAQRLGVTAAEAERRIHEVVEQRWMAVFASTRPRPGVGRALTELHDQGLALALLSDYPVGQKLRGLGLAELPFSVTLNAEETGALKPDRAPFEAVLARLDLPPERVLHIGDLEATDVSGALAAGMRAARIHERRRPPPTRAELVFRDWRELLPLLRARGMLPP
ncbi:MAG TPA: HAD family hydrolase [Myxococcota bacterium]|nr:HAD family hydrolase [Myxococcota bacterium]HRY93925.1 HAD family hydrolase [Myxococcota bacterium]